MGRAADSDRDFAPRSRATATNAELRLRAAIARHQGLLRRVLRRAGLGPLDAEDAAQDALWVLAQRLDSVPVSAERAFLVATALRVAADRRRSRWHRSVRGGAEPDEQPGVGMGVEEHLDFRRGVARLERALAGLHEDERDVYVLSELEELSRSEVSAALSIPKGTVATRLRRARGACAAALRALRRGR